MWRRLHVLSPVQSFVLATICAAFIALPITIQSVSHDDTALLRDLFWPHQLNPYVSFSVFFLGVLPALLGYFHLGRLGLLLSIAAGLVLMWLTAVFGILCFVALGHYSGSVRVSVFAYAAGAVLLYLMVAWLHLRASTAVFIRDAQRKLRLLPTSTL